MNIVKFILSVLKVPHSKTFIEEFYVNTPDYDNMLGIQRILSRYNIETIGVRYKEKNKAGLTFPCIMHLKHKIVIATDIVGETITFYDGKRHKTENISIFNKKWTGHVLLVKDIKTAKEPEYAKNRITDLYHSFINNFFVTLIALLGLANIVDNDPFCPETVNIAFDLLGLSICVLLFQKQLFAQSPIADKVCSMLQKEGCDPILKSEEAKLLGIIPWTEIGLAYFSSQIIFYHFNEGNLMLPQLIGWFAMPYGLWSIWYQAHKTKKWCFLCTLVQITIWAAGIYNIFVFKMEHTSPSDIVAYIAYGIFALLFIHILSVLHSTKEKYNNTNRDFLRFKSQNHIFGAALLNSTKIDVKDEDSTIIYGDETAPKTLTVLTNPHCAPCARMHQRLMKLVNEDPDIKIQYVYSSFNEKVEGSSLLLIAAYQQKPYEEVVKFLEQWYEEGRFMQEKFIANSGLDIHHKKVKEEYSKHTQWKIKSGIEATPTIIYKGHELPPFYDIEDFIYLDIEKEIPFRT